MAKLIVVTTDELVALYQSADSVPPLSALDGLDQADWSAVQDAYGPANKIPALLRALASSDPVHRDSAAQSLFEMIWHQGDVFSATATAVPFLYELLKTDGPHDKATVAVLLASIADGRPPFARCEDDPKAAAEWRAILSKSGRSLDAEVAEGRRYAAEIRRQLARQLDLLYPYVRDPHPDVRRPSPSRSASFPKSPSGSWRTWRWLWATSPTSMFGRFSGRSLTA